MLAGDRECMFEEVDMVIPITKMENIKSASLTVFAQAPW